ncbi:MAG: hypothetical protein A3F70_18870 [Acidobacteria bacterium RIFCSPLOWO2_12_FULL_67_14]|nr:MAG: hypothetical protein A3F70_18870 [Acidobacteria bacterium RIFCSPLOWO2_12_FULL_67_14]
MSIRSGSIRAVIALLLVGAGWVCWSAGALQARLADANGRMIVLRYQDSLEAYDTIEESIGLVSQIPARVTPGVVDLAGRRATALYWDKRYGSLKLERDAAGQLVESDPEILFTAANAAYRAGIGSGSDRVAAVRALDEAVANYAEVLRKAPGHVEAAYNYEYAVRTREAAARPGEGPRPRTAQRATTPAAGETGEAVAAAAYDLPAGPTLHGQPGAPPEASDNAKFKMLVPMRPEERQGTPDRAGEGARPLRRG